MTGDDGRKMLAFAHLAALSREKGQSQGEVRFVLLAGIAACRAGWPEVSRACRERVLSLNSAHLVGRFDTLEDALRAEDFAPFAQHLDRFCSFERAELLLERQGVAWERELAAGAEPLGDRCVALVGGGA